MNLPRSLFRLLVTAALAATTLSACAQAPRADGKECRAPTARTSRSSTSRRSTSFCSARSPCSAASAQLAAQTYLDLAKRTRDPRVARRAVEVASQARLRRPRHRGGARPGTTSSRPRRRRCRSPRRCWSAAKRVEEAEPYLEKLLTSDGVNLENGFLQLNRLVSGNPDKAANAAPGAQARGETTRSCRQAHFAIAQAASAASEDAAARSLPRAARRSYAPIGKRRCCSKRRSCRRNRPPLRRSASATTSPRTRSRPRRASTTRARWCSTSAIRRRASNSRPCSRRIPAIPRSLYAVGVLAFQLKDYSVAEDTLKRVLGMRYRDPDGVRYLLGQVAEEQKRWPQAIEWYEQIQDGDHALPARMRTAGAMAKQGKLDEAREFPAPGGDRQSRPMRCSSPSPRRSCLRDANRHGDAFALLGEALRKRQPEQPELLYDFALTAEKLERFDLLESNLRKLIQVRPEHAHAYNALGYSFADRNLRLRRGAQADREGARARARGLLHHGQPGLGAVPRRRSQGRGGDAAPRLRRPAGRGDRRAPRRGALAARPARRGASASGRRR